MYGDMFKFTGMMMMTSSATSVSCGHERPFYSRKNRPSLRKRVGRSNEHKKKVLRKKLFTLIADTLLD